MAEGNNESDFESWIKAIENGSEDDFQRHYKEEFLEKLYVNTGKLPIHIACYNGNFVKDLINKGCNIEANDNRKWRPLHYVCQKGGTEIVQLLIEKGCEIDPRNIADWTPLHYASGYGLSDIVQLLINNNCDMEAVESGDGWRPIHNACRFGHVENVKILLDNNCEYDVYDKKKLAPIHHACNRGNVEIVKLLLDKECNIEACDINNWRPIHYAASFNHINIVEKLLRCPCLIDVKTAENESPLDLAQKTNNQELINILIDEGKHEDLVNEMATQMGVKCFAECNHELCSKSLKLRNFKKGQLIGQGGFGKVYCIRNIAIKHVKYEVIGELNGKKQLINTKKGSLQHERIVKFYGAIINNSCYLVIFMEFIVGGSLEDKIKEMKKLPPNEIIHYSRQILEGLEFLHELRTVHRDIKPMNILLTKENNVKLADFDFFRSISGSKGDSLVCKTFCGTVNFMAPEILREESYDYTADIWSLGATIINMFTGKPPYHGLPDSLVIYKINQYMKLELPSDLPQQMRLFIEETLMSDPKQRPTASQLLTRDIFGSQLIE